MMKGPVRHGLRYTSEYTIWLSMKQRCTNPKNPSYKFYGGRGISMCQQWLDDFVNFYNDMTPRPSMDHEIDRIDNDKGYSKENCRWTKRTPNMRNTRLSKWWFVYGVRYPSLSAAAKALGVTTNRIKAWCEGRTDGGYSYPPKENCWSEKKYAS